MISKSHFITENISDIKDTFNIIKELGQGSYGHVIRVQHKQTGHIYACKKMNKKQIANKQRFKTEIDLLKATDHPNIVKLYGIFEDNIFLHLIMEECTGGEFFNRLAQRAKDLNMYTEKDAARIFKQLLGAVNYLHAQGVCHRDIKPENILFSTIDEEYPLKLIDFGLSNIFNGDDNTMKGIVGTTFYMAPEVLTGKYNEKCDVWACGVILYIMLCGKPPFYSKDENDLRHKICEMKYDFNFQEFQNVSEEAKDLIKSILVSKETRPSIQEVLEHKWIKENAPNSTNKVLNIDWFHIKKYSQLNLMQKCVINFTAFHLTEDETRQFVEMFNSLDENNDGVLTIEEIQNGIEKCQFSMKINTDDMIEMFNEMDVDKNGLINFTEFISALMDYEKYIKKEQLLECFKSYDSDGSGTISFEEFCDMIKPQDEEEKKKLFDLYKKYDENNDGEIDFNEFVDGFLKEL